MLFYCWIVPNVLHINILRMLREGVCNICGIKQKKQLPAQSVLIVISSGIVQFPLQ